MEYKVSVIVPVYNVEPYIERCLQSLISQTLQELEIILVDDASSDHSEDIILSYQQQYPEKIIYLKKEHSGLSDTRNHGLAHARGEYVAFLDSDDYVETEMYETMYQKARTERKKVVECDFYLAYPKKNVLDSVPAYTSVKDYFVRGRVVAWNKIYQRTWLLQSGVIFPKGLLYEDVEFFFSLMAGLDSIEDLGIVRQPFVYYVQRQDSISYSESVRVRELCDVYKNAFSYLRSIGRYDTYRNELEYKFARNALWGFPLKKVRHIKDKKIRREILEIFWKEVNTAFPDWKSNCYIKKKGLANLYLKLISRQMYLTLFMMI